MAGRNFTHDLSKLDYSSKEMLKITLKKVFPELDKVGIERRYEFESKYIGWVKVEDEKTGVGVWQPPK